MMTLETKITLHATEKDIEPLQNFLTWLEDMDCDIADACDKIIKAEVPGESTNIIYAILSILRDNIEID